MKSRSFSDLTWSIISRTLCFELFSWFSMSISSDSGIFVFICSISSILTSILCSSLLTSCSRSSINVSLVLSNFWWPKGHYINNTEEKIDEKLQPSPEDSWLWSWKAPAWLTSSKASDSRRDPKTTSKLRQEGRLLRTKSKWAKLKRLFGP